MVKIGSNQMVQRALSEVRQSSEDISKSVSKLSSGKRVENAHDDAASLAIGSRLKSEKIALSTSITNARQISSALQLADGAMARIQDITTRMRSLAVSAGSGHLDTADRQLLDVEYQKLASELDRIAKDTKFSGKQIVGATNEKFNVTGDFIPGQNGVINLVARQFDTNPPGKGGNGQMDFSVEYSVSAPTGTNSQSFTAPSNFNVPSTSVAQTPAIGTAPSASAVSGYNVPSSSASTNPVTTSYSNYGQPTAFSFTIDGVEATNTNNSVQFTQTINANDLTSLGTPNASIDNGMILRFSDPTVAGAISDYTEENAEIILTLGDDFALNPQPALIVNPPTAVIPPTTFTYNSEFSIGEDEEGGFTDLTTKVGSGISPTDDHISVLSLGATLETLALVGHDIKTAANADLAMLAIDMARDFIMENRAELGSGASRMEYAARNLSTTIENTEAARSRITDLDVAREVTRFTSQQIKIQSGLAITAQASDLQRVALQLFT